MRVYRTDLDGKNTEGLEAVIQLYLHLCAQSEIGKQIISNGRPQSEINKGMENYSTLFVERKENINNTKDSSRNSLLQ